MPTISADVTKPMQKWIDQKVKSGQYKSRSEVIRTLLREKMQKKAPLAALSQKAFEEVWDNPEDDIWETYL
jgi:putative addiction module CopG family antidote